MPNGLIGWAKIDNSYIHRQVVCGITRLFELRIDEIENFIGLIEAKDYIVEKTSYEAFVELVKLYKKNHNWKKEAAYCLYSIDPDTNNGYGIKASIADREYLLETIKKAKDHTILIDFIKKAVGKEKTKEFFLDDD